MMFYKSPFKQNRIVIFIVNLCLTLFFVTIINNFLYPSSYTKPKYVCPNQEYIFGDNITGFSENVVPNIVHYLLFGVNEIQFGHFISILSVIRNHKPEKIMIHCDCNQLIGDYYKRVIKISIETKTEIIVRTVMKPTEIFGKKIRKEWLNWHSADLVRIQVLQEFGGIFIDRDTYVVKSLNIFRKYEMTLEWDKEKNHSMSVHVLIANRYARFLKRYLDSYRSYDPNSWYHNAGDLPTKTILYKNPELIHRVKNIFGALGPYGGFKLYKIYFTDWQKDYFAIHMTIRNDTIVAKEWCFGKDPTNYPRVMTFDENIVRKLNVTFGEMSRLVLDYEKSIVS